MSNALRYFAAFGAAVVMFAALAAGGGSAWAMAGKWAANDHVSMRIVSTVEGVGDRSTLRLGLQFKLQPGWKIYWRSPGDAGYPPKPSWRESKNLAGIEVRWPAPERFSIFGLETLGYKDEVVLPITARLVRPGEPLELRASVDYLTCKDICVPYNTKAAIELPAGPAAPSALANMIDRYIDRVPGKGARHGLAIERVAFAPAGDGIAIRVEATALEPFTRPDLFVEGPPGAFFERPTVAYGDAGRRAVLTVVGGGVALASFEGSSVTLTLVDGGRAMEEVRVASLSAGPLPALEGVSMAPDSMAPSLVVILLLAVLGGLILNLMPCVLPVLSLKVLSAVGHGGKEEAEVRIGFIASAAGILFAFFVLALVLVVLQATGMAVGWGIQFQQPVFLAVMGVVVTLFACNLFGLFEARLPQAIADFASHHGDSHSLAGHFLTGAFATVLATPCSAPFLGTAVGFALSRGAGEIFAVFAALGLGLALPYLGVAAFPALATRLPKPGRWMVVLRRILGISLVATAVWLISVLAVQVGDEGALGVGALLVLIVVVMAMRKMSGSWLGRHAGKASAVLAVAAIAASLVVQSPGSVGRTALADTVWEPFDRAAIPGLVARGRTVFVDVTADWCITCRANKGLVLGRGDIAAWLASGRVVAMKADWTRPDPAISNYLAAFGRYGIPFNIVYGPKAPRGVPLPELLTSGAVFDAVARAGGAVRLAKQ